MTSMPVLCHVSTKISVFVLLVCCMLDWDKTLMLYTILSLWRRNRQSGNTRDRRRSGRPRVTSRRQDFHIRLVHLPNRFQTSSLTARSIPGLRPISSRTVRNRFREHNIRQRRPAIVQFCCLDTVQLG
jgi:hypothetical protein